MSNPVSKTTGIKNHSRQSSQGTNEKLPENILKNYEEELIFHQRILNQKKHDKDKIYRLHKPSTACIAKGVKVEKVVRE